MRGPAFLFPIVAIMAVFVSISACSGDAPLPLPGTDGDSLETDGELAGPIVAYAACEPDGVGPRPEHPRPDFCRSDWRNLNGEWAFAFDPDDSGLTDGWALDPSNYPETIIVPFPWQSPLSGLSVTDYTGVVWYARMLDIEEEKLAQGVQIVFGAVDFEAQLFVNGVESCVHSGGYTPFRCDITDALTSGTNTLILRAFDPGNDAEYPHGKQGRPWYQNIGGIWQTVYLETVPRTHIIGLRVIQPTGNKPNTLVLHVGLSKVDPQTRFYLYRNNADGVTEIEIAAVEWNEDEGQQVAALTIAVDESWIWNPETPNLVDLTVHACSSGACDSVTTYVGLRHIERAHLDGLDNQVIHLNGRPVHIRAPLVQGYHPIGHMTYPSESDIRSDLEAAKAMGFNTVRLHIKPEEPRVLYWADRLGLLVDYDMVNLGNFPVSAGDTKEGRARWEQTMREQVLRDRNHPSIIWWTLFNETWGLGDLISSYDEERQQWVLAQIEAVRPLVDSVLIEDMSPTQANMDHVVTDLLTWHFYIGDHEEAENHLDTILEGAYVGSDLFYTGDNTQPERLPLINTEFGPFTVEPLSPEWKHDRDISDAFRRLVSAFRARPEISGYVFTQLYDVEFEHNGLLDYDRGRKETGFEAYGCSMAGLQQDYFIGTEEGPSIEAAAGETLSIRPWLSTYEPEGTPSTYSWRMLHFAPGENDALVLKSSQADMPQVTVGKTSLAPIAVTLPNAAGAYALVIQAGQACNFLPVVVLPQTLGGWLEEDARYTYRVPMSGWSIEGDTDAYQRDLVQESGRTNAIGFTGSATLSALIELNDIQIKQTSSVTIEAELSANQIGMAQTDPEAHPSEIVVWLDDIEIARFILDDEWADSRGMLSHHFIPRTKPSGGYGQWRTISVALEKMAPLTEATKDGSLTLRIEALDDGGLMLFGPHGGRYPFPASLTIEQSR